MDDKNLVIMLKNNNKEAFTALYKRYWGKVYNFSKLYIKSAHVVEEVVQEVFVKLWESRLFIDENRNFIGFLFIITRNIIFNQSRKNLNEAFYKITVMNALEQSYDIEQELEAKHLKEYIDLLTAKMPPKQQEVFLLSRTKNLTYKEIAEKLSISEKTVERHINGALKFLKKNIQLISIFLLA